MTRSPPPTPTACVFLVDGRVNDELISASAEHIASRMTKLEAAPC